MTADSENTQLKQEISKLKRELNKLKIKQEILLKNNFQPKEDKSNNQHLLTQLQLAKQANHLSKIMAYASIVSAIASLINLLITLLNYQKRV